LEIGLPSWAGVYEPGAQLGGFWQFVPAFFACQSARKIPARVGFLLSWLDLLSAVLLSLFTGVLLMFYYHPAVPQAYRDMKDLHGVRIALNLQLVE
jgi:hypothetical protein